MLVSSIFCVLKYKFMLQKLLQTLRLIKFTRVFYSTLSSGHNFTQTLTNVFSWYSVVLGCRVLCFHAQCRFMSDRRAKSKHSCTSAGTAATLCMCWHETLVLWLLLVVASVISLHSDLFCVSSSEEVMRMALVQITKSHVYIIVRLMQSFYLGKCKSTFKSDFNLKNKTKTFHTWVLKGVISYHSFLLLSHLVFLCSFLLNTPLNTYK